jgi:hypothetical protein
MTEYEQAVLERLEAIHRDVVPSGVRAGRKVQSVLFWAIVCGLIGMVLEAIVYTLEQPIPKALWR